MVIDGAIERTRFTVSDEGQADIEWQGQRACRHGYKWGGIEGSSQKCKGGVHGWRNNVR